MFAMVQQIKLVATNIEKFTGQGIKKKSRLTNGERLKLRFKIWPSSTR